MKAPRTPAHLEALRRNAAKGRAKLAKMRKQGLPIGKEKMVTQEIPLAMVPMGAKPVKKYTKRREEAVDRDTVNALAQLIVATWAEVQRRKGAL
jgi:hypothetical protein